MSHKGLNILVTAGPTHEPIDPVRYIANHSSGKQGYAIAQALQDNGANVTLVTGPTALQAPKNCTVITVKTAQQMYDACMDALPVDIAIMAAAVADWSPMYTPQKIKKAHGQGPPSLEFMENPDILKAIATNENRPRLVVGFAAETENLIENAREKRARKNCDWILANDVSENVFGSDQNHVYLITENNVVEWPLTTKNNVALNLITAITEFLDSHG